MAYDVRLLEEILGLKGLTKAPVKPGQPQRIDNAGVTRLTKIPGDQLCHYLKGREPMQEALKKIADGLELDGNFLIGSGQRFKEMDLPHALAHMALDRYLQAYDVNGSDEEELRYLADTHPDLPMWSKIWRQIHESLKLAKMRHGSGCETPRPQPSYQRRRVRRRDAREA